MPCTMCGHESGYNRAIVDVLSGQQVGSLCRNCELDHFGRRLEMQTAPQATCVFCQRDGYYAIPVYQPSVESDEGVYVSRTEVEIDETTPQICEDHLERLQRFSEVDKEHQNPSSIITKGDVEDE